MQLGSTPMIAGMTLERELRELDELLWECTAFLRKWKAHLPYTTEVDSDAIVAILELKAEVEVRRRYILKNGRDLIDFFTNL